MASLSMFLDDLDDWCGNGRRPGPRPQWLVDVLSAVVISELATRVTQAGARQEIQQVAGLLMHSAGQAAGMTALEAAQAVKTAAPLGALSALMDEIDDWCGTPSHPGHGPRPHWLVDVFSGVVIAELGSRVTNGDARKQLDQLAGNLMRPGR